MTNQAVEEPTDTKLGDGHYTEAQVALFDADLSRRLQQREDAFERTVKGCLDTLRGYDGVIRPEERAEVIDRIAAELQNLRRFNDLFQARRYTKAYEFVASLETPVSLPSEPMQSESVE